MSTRADTDELRDEYDFTPDELLRAERGKYATRYSQGADVVPLDPEPAALPADDPSEG